MTLADALKPLHYRYRWPALTHTRLPLGLGALMLRTSRFTGRTDAFWRFAEDLTWTPLAGPAALDALPLCTSRAAVEALLTPASSAAGAAGVERAGCRPGRGRGGRHRVGRPGPSHAPGADRVPSGRRQSSTPAGEWVARLSTFLAPPSGSARRALSARRADRGPAGGAR